MYIHLRTIPTCDNSSQIMNIHKRIHNITCFINKTMDQELTSHALGKCTTDGERTRNESWPPSWTYSPVHIVAEKWDCRRKRRDNGDSRTFLRQSHFCATVSLFWDSVDRA